MASLDLADRVVAIQRVPMFAEVDVRDLESISDCVDECRYDPHEVIFRHGEWGDDMLMIVSGDVVLTTREGKAITRGPGEYVGELALLRHQPRSVDATAGPNGLHALVMDCRMLETILEERPRVATAMVRTLADRLADFG